jgi:tetratricopeptide (TPR) repeat protein
MRTAVAVTAAFVVSAASASSQSPVKPPSLAELEARAHADSNDPVAYFDWANALAKDGRYVVAEGVLRTAVQLDPQYAPALMLLARANDSRVTGLLAVTSGRRIIIMRVDPQAGETALLRRRAFLIDPLVEVGSPNREQLPSKWRGTLGPALHEYDAAHWAEAAAGFQSVIDRTVRPTDSTKVPPVALWYRARCALKLNEFDTAIQYLQWLHRLRMQDSASESNWNPFAGEELRYVLAYVHQQAGRWDEAITRYQELLEQNLGLDGAHTHLAEIYEAQGRLNDAVWERVRAIQSNPDATSLYFNLGATLIAAGRYEEAVASLKKYVESYPRDARAFYLIGASHMNLGNTASAQTALKSFLTIAPSRYTAQIEDAKRRLGTLGN